MGHDTHGLQLAPRYLEELASGAMRASGEPAVVSDRKAAIVWDGRHISGVWLTATALDLASERARDYGTATIVIREAHHIACLAAYLPRVTSRGQAVLITTSDPAVATGCYAVAWQKATSSPTHANRSMVLPLSVRFRELRHQSQGCRGRSLLAPTYVSSSNVSAGLRTPPPPTTLAVACLAPQRGKSPCPEHPPTRPDRPTARTNLPPVVRPLL